MRAEARHSILLVMGTGVSAGLGLLYSVYVGRKLGPAAYSEFAAAISFIFICSIATGLINPTVARFTAEYKGRGEPGKILSLAREVGRRVAVYGLVGIVAVLLCAGPLSRVLQFRSPWPLAMACAVVYSNLLLSVVRGVLRGAQEFGQHNLNGILESVLRLLIGVALLAWAANTSVALSAYALAVGLVLLLAPAQLRRIWAGARPQRLDGAAVKRFTVPIFVMSAVAVGFDHLDMLFAKRVFEATDAGLYGAAATLTRTINALVTPFMTLMLPLLTTLHDRKEATTGTFLRVCGYFLALVSVPMAAFVVWPEWIMVLLYSGEYAGAGRVLTYLAAGRLLSYLAQMVCMLFAARNHFRFLYVYVPGLGVLGAAMGLWHSTPEVLAGAVLGTHAVVLLAMGSYLWTQRRPSHRKPEAKPDPVGR